MERHYTEADTDSIAEQILTDLPVLNDKATVLALRGELGAGKTTLTKSIAKILGIEETVVSPTFVVAKFYDSKNKFKKLIHIDAYRIESLDELIPIRFKDILTLPETLVIIEWPEKIEGALPEGVVAYELIHKGEERTIKQYEI